MKTQLRLLTLDEVLEASSALEMKKAKKIYDIHRNRTVDCPGIVGRFQRLQLEIDRTNDSPFESNRKNLH